VAAVWQFARLTDFKIDYQERAMTEKKVPTSSTAKKSGSRPAAAKNASPAIMEKEAESKEVKTALSTTVTTVTTSALKGQFAAGSIPLSTDFGNLIDIAECGRRAIGQSADQTDNSIGVGLALATDDDAANKGKLSVKAGDGITVNANGVSVKAGDGLEFVSSNLEVKSAKGITVDDSGVNLHIGNGLTFDNYALTIDQKTLLPTEMIMMYCPPSGTTTPPDGWIFCDGSDCRAPNLVDRFILGGSASSVGGKNSTTLSEDSNSKSFSATSDNGNLVLAASIDSTALTVAQMPKHSHDIIMSGSPQWALYEGPHHTMPTGDNTDTINPAYIADSGTRLINTDAGEDNGHSHGVHISSLGHSHGLIIAVPYYILTFIMKT